MVALDIISYVRVIMAESDPNQRFSDSNFLTLTDRAQKIVVRDILFPESRFVFNSATGVQEYQLQEVIRINRVYIQGQPIIRTTKAILEGQQIQFNDQTGSGGGPSGIIQPNSTTSTGAASPIVVGQFTPQWTGQPSATYPVSSDLGFPAPSAAPWMPGMRPRYYLNGGNIGFVPAPSGVYPIVIDCIRQPATLSSTSQPMLLPDIALDALAWKVCELAYFADRSEQGSEDVRNYAMSQYQTALGDLRTWKRQYTGYGPRGPKPVTMRSFYTKGNNRFGQSGWGN